MLYLGDCLEVMKTMDENSIDTVLTDPPYGLNFMGKDWDHGVPGVAFWKEALRVAKPGAILMAFGGTRTVHRLACAIEDAGWIIRDRIFWIYGSGFPKSHNISKAIDKRNGRYYDKSFREYVNSKRVGLGYSHQKVNEAMGLAVSGGGFSSCVMGNKEQNELPTLEMYLKLKPILSLDNRFDELIKRIEAEREVVGKHSAPAKSIYTQSEKELSSNVDITAPATPAAELWDGYGTALKPAHEPIIVAMKPLDGTFAENAQKWGVAGLWIDGGRVDACDNVTRERDTDNGASIFGTGKGGGKVIPTAQGRWPANVIHDGTDEVVGLFPRSKDGTATAKSGAMGYHGGRRGSTPETGYGGSGSAARFFMKCEQDKTCLLCLTQKHGTMSAWKNTLVSNAEKNGWTTQAISEFIARLNALEQDVELSAQNVSGAENLCASCATLIAVTLAATKNLVFKKEESRVILDYIGDFKNCTQIQSLASFVEKLGSTDIIQTMTSLWKLFGSVHRATEEYINQGTRGVVEQRSEQTRFRYCSKASKAERNAGLEGMEKKHKAGAEFRPNHMEKAQNGESGNPYGRWDKVTNNHPTVKPLALMRYLCKLTKTPSAGIVLDPFMGSGTTGVACAQLGRKFIGCEIDPEYFAIAQKRISDALLQIRLL